MWISDTDTCSPQFLVDVLTFKPGGTVSEGPRGLRERPSLWSGTTPWSLMLKRSQQSMVVPALKFSGQTFTPWGFGSTQSVSEVYCFLLDLHDGKSSKQNLPEGHESAERPSGNMNRFVCHLSTYFSESGHRVAEAYPSYCYVLSSKTC